MARSCAIKAGRPTGVFKDNALSIIDRVQPDPTMQQQLDATMAAMDYLAARGVTAVHHLGTWQQFEVFRVAERRGLMKTRIYACTPSSQWERLAKEVKERGRGDDWLRIGGLKGFVDGSLGSHTAAFLEPFSDKAGDRGLLVNTQEDLEKWTMAPIRPACKSSCTPLAIGRFACSWIFMSAWRRRTGHAIGVFELNMHSTSRRRTCRGSRS